MAFELCCAAAVLIWHSQSEVEHKRCNRGVQSVEGGWMCSRVNDVEHQPVKAAVVKGAEQQPLKAAALEGKAAAS